MTAPQGVVTEWSGGTTSVTIETPTCQAGDFLIIIVGGGNRTTNVPAGWDYDLFLTGQEAQGCLYTRTAEADETGTPVTITFDGTDQRYVVAVAVKDWEWWDWNVYDRVGTAGGTLGATTLGWSADQYQGDLLLTFAFCRNGATAPTMARGVLWEAQASDGSSAAIYLESLPEFNLDEPFGISLPARSGHMVYSLPIYNVVLSEWIQGPDYEVITSQLGGSTASGVRQTPFKTHSDSRIGAGGFPTIDQADFLASQAAQVFVDADTPTPASWGHDRSGPIGGVGDWSRSWNTRRRHVIYSARLSDAALTEPANDTMPADSYGDRYTDPDSPARAIAAHSAIEFDHIATDTTTGSSLDLHPGSAFATGVYVATSVTINTSAVVTAWDPEATGTLLYVASGELSPSTTTDTVDLTDAIRSDGRSIAVISHVTGPSGSGSPTLELQSYTFEGTASFGARVTFPIVADGGGLYWTIRPALRRHEVRRSPVVDIIPVIETYLRRFPADTSYGFGNVARHWPPSRRHRRLFGQQP